MRPATPDYIEQSLSIIRNAENSLWSLVSQAAGSRDADAIAKMMASATAIGEIAQGLLGGAPPKESSHAVKYTPADYPKFFRSNDNKLIVLGWSPKTRTEYEHKAPKIVLDRLADILLDHASEDEPAPIDRIKKYLAVDEGESEFPEYFLRAFLRWLRAIGLISKDGHRGYYIKKSEHFKDLVNASWKKLTIR
jgi:hypothetical protein